MPTSNVIKEAGSISPSVPTLEQVKPSRAPPYWLPTTVAPSSCLKSALFSLTPLGVGSKWEGGARMHGCVADRALVRLCCSCFSRMPTPAESMAWYLSLLVATPLSDKGCSPSPSKLEPRKGCSLSTRSRRVI